MKKKKLIPKLSLQHLPGLKLPSTMQRRLVQTASYLIRRNNVACRFSRYNGLPVASYSTKTVPFTADAYSQKSNVMQNSSNLNLKTSNTLKVYYLRIPLLLMKTTYCFQRRLDEKV